MSAPADGHRIDQMPLSEWGQLRSELVWVYEGEVPAEYREVSHHFPGQSAILLLVGSLTVQTEKGELHATAGDWVFPRQGTRLQRFTEDARVLSVRFQLHWPGGQPLFQWDVAVKVRAEQHPRLEAQARKLLRFVDHAFPGAWNRLPWEMATLNAHMEILRMFSGWTHAYVATLLDVGVTPTRLGNVDKRVLEAIHRLDHAGLDEPMLEAALAQSVGLSTSQLDRLFVKHFNFTPRQYFERRRLEAAISHVQSSSMPMKQIAYLLGFSSLAYFSRWFRVRTGISPREFQKTGLLKYKTQTYMGMDTEAREVL